MSEEWKARKRNTHLVQLNFLEAIVSLLLVVHIKNLHRTKERPGQQLALSHSVNQYVWACAFSYLDQF